MSPASASIRQRLLALGEPCAAQPAADWQGDIALPAELERFYREVGPLDCTLESAGNPFFLPSLARLWQRQAGYRWHGIAVHYAKRQQGRKVFAAQTSHLPLKVNMAGVIPAIFASSILLFPASLGSWFGQSEGLGWLQDVAQAIAPGQPLNILLFTAGIVFFCFFYTALMFNPKDVAENLKKSGAFIPGIRPGEQSARYIDGVLTRLTMFGALYMTAVCLLPQFLVVAAHVPFYLGGTSLLIVVVVVMDFMAQVQSHLVSHQYESLMKKANLKGYGSGMLR